MCWAYFQDPADGSWHRLEWEHAAGLGTPFSGEAARYARRLAARSGRWPDTGQALGELLARWDQGMVTSRRERRMAVRLAAERPALPDPADTEAAPGEAVLHAVPDTAGDDDDPDEIFDDPDDADFYADAFEIIE